MVNQRKSFKVIFIKCVKIAIITITLLACYQPAQAEEGDLLWANKYELSGTDVYSGARYIKETSDGGYAFCGNEYYKEGGILKVNVVLVKVDTEGDTTWTRSYCRGDANYWDWVYSMAVTSDGGYAISGVRQVYNTTDQIFLLRTNSEGDSLYARILSGSSFEESYVGYSTQCTNDDGLILAGYSWPRTDLYVQGMYVKLDSQGNTEWTKKIPGNSSEGSEYAFFDIHQVDDGGYILAGVKNYVTPPVGRIDSSQAILFKTGSDGSVEWNKTVGSFTLFHSVKELADGGYICTGEINHLLPNPKVLLVKFDSDGRLIWERSYEHPDHDSDAGIAVFQIGDEGYLIGCNGTYNYSTWNTLHAPMLIKTDNDGEVIGMYDYSDEMLGGTIAINGMEITSDNNYLICGWTDIILGEHRDTISINDSYVMKMQGATIDIDNENALPQEFSLSQNYPNPFNATTSIEFSLNKADDVTLSIYDILGRKINTLHDGQLQAGTHNIIWNGANRTGEPVSSGVYFYRLENSEGSQSKQMILLK